MTTKVENSAVQIAAATLNRKQWGSIAYNAIVEGVIEGGEVDTTDELQALVNKAVSEGRRTILLPHVTNGEYYVTALENADQVDFVGDNCTFVGGYSGTIGNLSGSAELEAEFTQAGLDSIASFGQFFSGAASWLGLKCTEFVGDNGTRFYLIPKDVVTDGTGGALKIFADNYPDSAAYRDLGIYFSANQGGDTGKHGTGVFWINSKGEGAAYADKHPDIGFSFYDGAVIGGRFSYVNKTSTALYYPVFVIGDGESTIAELLESIRAEVHGDVGLENGRYLRWLDNVGTLNGRFGIDTNNYFNVSSQAGYKFTVADVLKLTLEANQAKFEVPIIQDNRLSVTTSSTSVDMTGKNRAVFNVGSAHTISTITGVNGQRVTFLFRNGNTTIAHNSTIKLTAGANYTGAADRAISLENFDNVWYQA